MCNIAMISCMYVYVTLMPSVLNSKYDLLLPRLQLKNILTVYLLLLKFILSSTLSAYVLQIRVKIRFA